MNGRGAVLYGNEGGVWMGGMQYPTEMREGCSTYGNEGGVWMGGLSTLWK